MIKAYVALFSYLIELHRDTRQLSAVRPDRHATSPLRALST